MRNWLLLLCTQLAFAAGALANGLTFGPVSVLDAQTISFSVEWENSWRLADTVPDANHDAVWIFLKYRKNNGGWHHRNLSADASAHTATGNLQLQPSADGAGAFVSRQQIGTGTIAGQLTLTLEAPFGPGEIEILAQGIEMVWIPDGPFSLGDGVSTNSFANGTGNQPFTVASEDEIELGSSASQLWDGAAEHAPAGNIPAAYPKGFAGFYAMKYEVSQEQYMVFLNHLTAPQQAARVGNGITLANVPALHSTADQYRNGIVVEVPQAGNNPAVFTIDLQPGTSDDGQTRACNFLNWQDLAAYLDWSALRPFTELEFEKMCRGSSSAVPGEFAWGTDSVIDANTLAFDGSTSETCTDSVNAAAGLASHGYDGPQGPLRCGFSSHYGSKQGMGASQYGVMELSGNLWELCITVNEAALQFSGTLGDGNLAESGEANETDWQAGVEGHRGGAWNSGIGPVGQWRDLAVSDRWYAGLSGTARRNTVGGRGVRQKDW